MTLPELTGPPGELEHARLFAPTLPEEFAWVLDNLFELDRLKGSPGLTKADRRARARALYATLEHGLSPFREPTPPEHGADAARFRAWFAEAALLWVHFGSTGGTVLVDTVGAETLARFPVDLPADPATAERVKRAVGEALGLSPDALAEAERKVSHLTSNLELKRRIARALAASLPGDGQGGPERRLALMQDFYGPLTFRPGDVDVVIASAALFFFVPRKGSGLDVPGFDERPEAERQGIRDFFAKVDRANTAETRRFPAFGLYEPEAMSPALVERVAAACVAPSALVRATLATMFALTPTSLHAQYLVHDLWGHTWQEALSEFEWEYALLPALDRPLSPLDGPEFGGRAAPTLGSAFVEQNGETVLDTVRLLAFGEADLRGRIQVATSVPLSEVLADFMESKFSRARPELELPTSSLLASTSLKLDLTISDTRTQVQRYTRPYRKLAVDREEQARLATELRSLGLPRAGLDAAVAQAGRFLWHSFQVAFDDSLAPEPASAAPGAVRSSVMRRLLLQLSLVVVDLEHSLAFMRRDAEGDVWKDPQKSPDLLAIALTHFYEQDRQHNFWHMDQIARSELKRACELLRAALGD